VRSEHHAQVVALQKRGQLVRPVRANVILLLRVSHEVVAEAFVVLSVLGVAPQDVDYFLVVARQVTSQLDADGSLNLVDTVDVLQRRTDSTVTAQDALSLISDDGCKRHLLEGVVDLGEDTVRVVDVFVESLGTLVSEAVVLIHVAVLVVASQQNDLLWELELESEEQADHLETPGALVHVVAKEDVVVGVNVAGLTWRLPDVEESHQINVLAVEVTEHLAGWSHLLDDDGLCRQHLSALHCQLQDVLLLAGELHVGLDVLTLLGLQQWLQEHLAQRFMRVLFNLAQIFVLWDQLLGFFCQFVN